MNRKEIWVNGYRYWISEDGSMLYESETCTNGIFVDSIYVTADEQRQIKEYLKYRDQSNIAENE